MNVYSNAFNFNTHLSGSVDVRTGQYGCLIRLATLYPQGPLEVSREIVLTFSMMNTQASGNYGAGWRLSNTEFDVATSRLTLITGEQFQTQSLPSVGRTLVIKDHKLKDVVVQRVAESTLHVIYKDGTVEILGRPSSSGPYKINAIQFENGERLSFRYPGGGPLERILDHNGEELLLLTYIDGVLAMADTRVEGGRHARTRFTHANTNNQLTSVTAPYDRTQPPGTAAYEFIYTRPFRNGLIAISEVKSPMGGNDLISYEENGHQYANGQYIPRVVGWRQTPGASQPSMAKTYSYSTGCNFTGFPFGGGFREGEDNLYLVAGDYDYWTEETSIDIANKDAVLSTTRDTFNKFHLMTEEQVRREGTRVTTTIAYNVLAGKLFPDQPANLQLPREVTKRFELVAGGQGREEVQVIQTDDYGNELSRTESTGVRTEYSYYPIAGDGDKCPADPHDFFQRYLKQERLVPANTTVAPRITEHTHTRLSTANGGYFVLQLATSRAGAAFTQHAYYDQVSNPALHGRLKASTTTLDRLAQTTDFSYSVSADTLTETRRLEGREAGQRLTSARALSLTNRRILSMTRDASSVLAMTFDVSGRLMTETAAPGKPQKAERRYDYHFAVADKLAHLVTTDANGNKVATYFDGLGRQVSAMQCLQGSPPQERLLGTWRYDALGQIVEQTRVDYLSDGPRSLTTVHGYNKWGNASRVVQPDGQVLLDDYDPLQNLRVTGTEGGVRLQTWFNAHNQPVRVERLSSKGVHREVETRTYDGLGRCTALVDARKTRTQYTYDAFDRVVSTLETPSDGTPARDRLTEYMPGTSEQMASGISVNGKCVGTCSYDSLGRVTSQARGNAAATGWEYKADQLYPTVEISPRGDRQTQRYDPELDVLTSIQTPGHPQADFQHDLISGAMRHSQVSSLKHQMHYDSNGYLEEEVQTSASATLTGRYSYSPGGRLLKHVAADGQNSVLTYDSLGRFSLIVTGALGVTQTYDSLGRPHALVTTYRLWQLIESVTYDEWGLESVRRLELGGGLLQSVASTYDSDGLLATRVVRGENNAVLTGETFNYDGYSRLTTYQCEGTEYPQDSQGRGIKAQAFSYDALDNLTAVTTSFADGSLDTSARFFQGDDPTRLTRVTHTNPARDLHLTYDAAGNLLRGVPGRTFGFNHFDQLASVQTDTFKYTYEYDAEARQVLASRGAEAPVMLAYAGDRLDTLVQGAKKIRYLRAEDPVLVRMGGVEGLQMLAHDASGSVRGTLVPGQDLIRRQYAPYGNARIDLNDGKVRALADLQLPAFNGERLDVPVNLYHLGNGRRAYDPELMIFLSPDPLSPFDEGGLNSYAYCVGDPINRVDPSGYFSLPTWARWTLTGVALGLTVVTLGFGAVGLLGAIAASAATMAIVAKSALVAASVAGVIGGTLGLAALGIEAVDKQKGWDRSHHINNLGWASAGFAVAGWVASFGGAYASASLAYSAAQKAATLEKVAKTASFFDKPLGAGLLAAGKQIVGLSYKFTDKSGVTTFSQSYGAFRFGLRVFNSYRSADGRVKSLQSNAPIEPDDEQGIVSAQPQGQPLAYRFIDMPGSSASFHQAFRDEVMRIRQPILTEWSSA